MSPLRSAANWIKSAPGEVIGIVDRLPQRAGALPGPVTAASLKLVTVNVGQHAAVFESLEPPAGGRNTCAVDQRQPYGWWSEQGIAMRSWTLHHLPNVQLQMMGRLMRLRSRHLSRLGPQNTISRRNKLANLFAMAGTPESSKLAESASRISRPCRASGRATFSRPIRPHRRAARRTGSPSSRHRRRHRAP